MHITGKLLECALRIEADTPQRLMLYIIAIEKYGMEGNVFEIFEKQARSMSVKPGPDMENF